MEGIIHHDLGVAVLATAITPRLHVGRPARGHALRADELLGRSIDRAEVAGACHRIQHAAREHRVETVHEPELITEDLTAVGDLQSVVDRVADRRPQVDLLVPGQEVAPRELLVAPVVGAVVVAVAGDRLVLRLRVLGLCIGPLGPDDLGRGEAKGAGLRVRVRWEAPEPRRQLLVARTVVGRQVTAGVVQQLERRELADARRAGGTDRQFETLEALAAGWASAKEVTARPGLGTQGQRRIERSLQAAQHGIVVAREAAKLDLVGQAEEIDARTRTLARDERGIAIHERLEPTAIQERLVVMQPVKRTQQQRIDAGNRAKCRRTSERAHQPQLADEPCIGRRTMHGQRCRVRLRIDGHAELVAPQVHAQRWIQVDRAIAVQPSVLAEETRTQRVERIGIRSPTQRTIASHHQ